MKYRLLGRSGLRVSELCLGAGTFGTNWGPLGSDKAESRRIFDAFAEAGGNFVDTSNRYQEGMSEELLGEFLKDAGRDRFVVGSKFSLYDTFAMMKDPNAAGNHRKNLVRSVDASLKRLQTDYIDLLWIHIWDYTTPIEETLRAMDDLVRQGKVMYIGASNVPAWLCSYGNAVADRYGWTPFSALQVEYNLVERSCERDFVPMAKAMDMAVCAWSPLSGGMTTGKYNRGDLAPDQPHRHAGLYSPEAKHVWSDGLRRNLGIMEKVVQFSDEIGKPTAQVALNFLRNQGVIPIFSARTLDQVKEDLACIDWELTPEQLEKLREVTRESLTQPIVEQGYPNDFLDWGSPAITAFNVKQMTWGFVGKDIINHRAVQYPHGAEVRPEP